MQAKTYGLFQDRRYLWVFPLVIAALFVFSQTRSVSYNITEVPVAEAKRMIDEGALVIDVRGEEAYGDRHLPNAVSVPIRVLRKGIPQDIAVASDRSVVVYCNDGARTGPEATYLLNRAGISRAVNVKGGIEGWAGAGYAVQPRH